MTRKPTLSLSLLGPFQMIHSSMGMTKEARRKVQYCPHIRPNPGSPGLPLVAPHIGPYKVD
ncbi:MAG: hypothetical protein AAF633_27130 [Chloroflexota bacterium]